MWDSRGCRAHLYDSTHRTHTRHHHLPGPNPKAEGGGREGSPHSPVEDVGHEDVEESGEEEEAVHRDGQLHPGRGSKGEKPRVITTTPPSPLPSTSTNQQVSPPSLSPKGSFHSTSSSWPGAARRISLWRYDKTAVCQSGKSNGWPVLWLIPPATPSPPPLPSSSSPPPHYYYDYFYYYRCYCCCCHHDHHDHY